MTILERTEAALIPPHRHFIPTRFGSVELVFRPVAASARPILLFVHGAGRHVAGHVGWFSEFGDDVEVVLVELPGHGAAPWLLETSVSAWISAIDEAVSATFPGRRIVAAGESLGGLIAFGLPGVEHVIAFDPPLSTGKLWPIHRDPELLSTLSAEFWWNIFGAGVPSRDISYRHVVMDRRGPATIVAGDRVLGDPRSVQQVPAFLDSSDKAFIATLQAISVVIITDAGHALLDEQPRACFDLVADVLAGAKAAVPGRVPDNL